MKITFQKITERRTKRWVDANGKKRQKTVTFMKTVNPWNRNEDGTVRTPEEIRVLVRAEADAWAALPASEVAK